MATAAGPPKVLPLFDLFLDLPHPGCSLGHTPPILVKGEQEEDLGQQIAQIASFAFPEYDQSQQPPQRPPPHGQPLVNKYARYAMQSPGFQQFTFTLQLQSGSRVHGHVRRYLPNGAGGRFDIGRRPERALVILTRISGADLLFNAILKSVEALAAQETALAKDHSPRRSGDEPNHHWFLRALANYHQHLAQAYLGKPISERGKPLIAALEGIEVGNLPLFNKIDITRFVMPTAMLQPPTCSFAPVTFTTSMLPLLRCVGVAHTLRLMSALLSERRIILVSSSPTRLTSCSHAALAILAQGMLYWQHLYIPVLPPHMWQYLAAPYPYLIGILTESYPKLDRTDGLGEVLVLNLDQNNMETRNMDQRHVPERLPDLFVPQQRDFIQERALSLPESLASDLQDVLKMDKKVVYGVDALSLQNVSETAVKAGKYAKKTIVMLAGKTNKFLNKGVNMALKRDGDKSAAVMDESFEEELVAGEINAQESERIPEKTMDASYIYSESCHIEVCEEEARLAFATFFVCMFGNMRWYLSTPPGEQVPRFDGNRFLQEKQRAGEGEGTPMFVLLRNFTQAQMFHEFAKGRVEEVRSGQPVAPDMPLFLQCTALHRRSNLDYGILTVRRTCQQIAETSPQRVTGQLQSTARRNAMLLTSNKNFEGDYNGTIAQLVEQCRECTLVLFDVMSVCWLRLQDCKGLNWKHAYHALQILRNLLYHGPVAAVTEATDGLDKIRALKYYDNMRAVNAQQVRAAAATVYSLLVDRSKLFNIRRFCIERRRDLANPRPRAVRDRRFDPTVPFRNLHAAASPVSQVGTRVAIPPTAPAPVQIDRGTGPTQDLLGSFTSSAGSSTAVAQQPGNIGSGGTRDLLGSFTGMNLSQNAAPTPASASSNPFDAFAAPVAQVASAPPQVAQARASHVPPSQEAAPQQQTFAHPGPQLTRAAPTPQSNAQLQAQQSPFTQQPSVSPQPHHAAAALQMPGQVPVHVNPGHPKMPLSQPGYQHPQGMAPNQAQAAAFATPPVQNPSQVHIGAQQQTAQQQPPLQSMHQAPMQQQQYGNPLPPQAFSGNLPMQPQAGSQQGPPISYQQHGGQAGPVHPFQPQHGGSYQQQLPPPHPQAQFQQGGQQQLQQQQQAKPPSIQFDPFAK